MPKSCTVLYWKFWGAETTSFWLAMIFSSCTTETRLDELDISVVCWGWWCGVRWKGKGGVDIGECGLTFNSLMVQQLNHLSEYGGCLAPRDNQDFDPYVSPLRSLIHRCDYIRGGKTILQSIGVYSTFCFSLQVIFLFNFFCFRTIS